jgi:uncharacterized protein (TIGR02449 family)
METINLKHIEPQINALLKAYQRLKQENLYLIQRQSKLLTTLENLRKKNQLATSQLKSLIQRLKIAEGNDV